MKTTAIRALLLVASLAACTPAAAATSERSAAPTAAAPSPIPEVSAPTLADPSTGPAATASPSAPAKPQVTPTPFPTATPLPSSPTGAGAGYCRVGDTLTTTTTFDEHAATILDWTYRLPADYVPPDLVNIGGGQAVRAIAYEDLNALIASSFASGHPLFLVSAYRSYAVQAQTFDYWTKVGGYQQALMTSARAGHSEHQLGTAIDFGDGTRMPWEHADWATTPTGAWLAAHAADHGFVMSFPKGKTDVTCYAYEPWHYRYVGKTVAHEIAAQGVTLREYQAARTPR